MAEKLTHRWLVFTVASGLKAGAKRRVRWDDLYRSGFFDRSLHDYVPGPPFVVKWDHERTRGSGTMIVRKEIEVTVEEEAVLVKRLS